MATVSFVILPHLEKQDGTNFIRLRITHNRRSRYIKTNILADKEDFTRSGKFKHQGKIDLIDAEMKEIRSILSGLPTSLSEDMSIDEIMRYIEGEREKRKLFRLDFYEYGMKLADGMKRGTGDNYRAALRCLVRYFGHNPDISEITVRSLRGFAEYIRNEPKKVYNHGELQDDKKKTTGKSRAVILYLSAIRAVYRRARVEFNDPDLNIARIPIDLFQYYKLPKPQPAKHRDKSEHIIQMMIDQRKGLSGRARLAVDSFLLSFGLMGMNAVDLYTCTRLENDVLEYNRAKTADRRDDGALMRIRIEECIKGIVADYKGRNRVFSFSELHSSRNTYVTTINAGLRIWCEQNKIERFTFYSARHTWGTLARSKRCGIDKSVVGECLCHLDEADKMNDIYIRRDWEVLWEANAKVLGLFKW